VRAAHDVPAAEQFVVDDADGGAHDSASRPASVSCR
jgi:hypothetical protein